MKCVSKFVQRVTRETFNQQILSAIYRYDGHFVQASNIIIIHNLVSRGWHMVTTSTIMFFNYFEVTRGSSSFK